ncbi:DsbA family protein [Microbacterium pygmaeum]|uniref:Thioredoxin n=1 Tax=Microbacterium pygmaeum TaxID=370764 RepID=A0A1G7YA13_9MICO|nr:thioredoxin domain-containing protein [Microbacterium pygmaeum]SDG93308.1 Thioredoxin [Microbacterium pygmaeum]
MSNDESPNVPAQRDRRHAVREKAQQVQAQQSRARVIRTTSLVVAIAAVIAIAAVVVTWTVTTGSSRPLMKPANVTDDGFVVTSVPPTAATAQGSGSVDDTTAAQSLEAAPTAEPTAEPTQTAQPVVDIRIYVDYLSTGSRDFQLANSQQLSKWVSQDAATLTYYPVAMLTAKSNGTKYSLRAASAAACVATHSPDAFFKFNNDLLAQQPTVDSDGYNDSELAAMAIAAGSDSPKTVRSCIEKEDFASWAKTATERALQGLPDTDELALMSTPTVLVNGVPYVGALNDPKEFAQFVLTSASDAYYETPTPAPTATTSPSATETATPTPTP